MAASSSAETKARALEQCERDLDVAIERLVNLRLDAAAEQHYSDGSGGAGAYHDDVDPAAAAEEEEEEAQRTVVVINDVPSDSGIDDDKDRAEWIERLVDTMSGAKNWGDARVRAARILEDFDAAVCRAKRDVALRQNGLLKRAVRVQHRRCMEKEVAKRYLQRQLAACQERVKSLETENYALSVYLMNAQPRPQGGAVTGRFHPEVF